MTKPFTPTLYQHMATDYQRNLAVTAGAGTGKTAVLTRRIIKILTERKHFLDRLLVVTFTDKAAVEMKERIFAEIEDELARTGDVHLQKLKDTFFNNYISTFHAFCAAILREYPIEAGLDPYFRVMDETEKVFFLRKCIHGKLKEIARDKNNRDIHLLSGEMSRPAMAEAIFKVIQKREDTGKWIKEFSGLSWEDYEKRLQAYADCILREMAYKLYRSQELNGCIDGLKEINPSSPNDYSVLTRKKENLLTLLPEFTEKLSESVEGSVEGEELNELKKEILKNVRLSGSPSKAWQGEPYDNIKGVFSTIRYLLDSFDVEIFKVKQSHEKRGFELLQALGNLTRQCLKTYHEAKGKENYLDFQDLQLKIMNLLLEEKHSHIVDELRERFQYIMVDEFQDTNDLQWQIIKRIAVDNSGELVNPRLFVVGDEKQAIYSFRGGDVSLFSRVRQELKKGNRDNGLDGYNFDLNLEGQKNYTEEYSADVTDDSELRSGDIVFAHNFRSAAQPINFFNMFFHDLLHKEVYEEFDARPQSLKCAGNKNKGSVELLLVDNNVETSDEIMDQEMEPHHKEAMLIVHKLKEVFTGHDEKYERIREKARAGEPACAILLNRRTKIKTYEEALRMNRINFSVVRGRGFYQRQEIVDLGNLLRFLNNSRDQGALMGFLYSPVCHLTHEGIFFIAKEGRGIDLWEKLQSIGDEDKKPEGLSERDFKAVLNALKMLSRWLSLAGRMPLMEFLQLILNEGGYYASLARGSRGQQAMSNIEKLLDSARDLSLQDHMDLADFSQWLDNRIDYIEEEGEADIDVSLGGTVQIMTVHQAKGLEFPLVFVPDSGAVFNLGEKEALDVDYVPCTMDIEDGCICREEFLELGINAPDPENEWESEPVLVKRIIKKRLREKLISEKKRLLYVAATRAMDHLILVGNSKFSSSRVVNRIRYAPLDQLNNWMDWMNKILGISFSANSSRGEIFYDNMAGESMTIPYRKFTVEESFWGSPEEYRTEFPL